MKFLLWTGTFLLVACVAAKPSPVKCDQILDTKIASVNWEALDSTSVNDWLKKSFPGISARNPAQDTFTWESGGRHYELLLNPFMKRAEYALDPQPTLKDVMNCYGAPSWFAIVDAPAPHNSGVRFTVWYPALGLRFEWNEYGNWIRKEFTEETPLKSLIVSKPGTLDEQVESIAGKAFKSDAMKTIKPWPTETPFRVKAS
jgi:hypothetical protein